MQRHKVVIAHIWHVSVHLRILNVIYVKYRYEFHIKSKSNWHTSYIILEYAQTLKSNAKFAAGVLNVAIVN